MTQPVQIASDPEPTPPPAPAADAASSHFRDEQDSHRRAMPLQRLLGGGMRHADAVALHAMAEAGIGWSEGGEWLGERNLRLAAAAGTIETERSCLRYASACFRAAQAAIPTDTDRKKQLYARMIDAFAKAGALDQRPMERHEVEWAGGRICGWLMRPEATGSTSVVIVLGGFDGWREEYHAGAAHLVRRGIAAFLVDGPGQGETRLFHGLFLDADFHKALAAAALHLRERCGLGPFVGIWGNSLGGFLAAKTAAAHPDFDALCVNGGTMRPLELPERYPRFFEKIEALVGTTDRSLALEIMEQLDLDQDVEAIRCPLLQLHSIPDPIFHLANARPIHDRASSKDKTLLIWDDGDHCMYNHSDEKHMVVADWFCKRFVSTVFSKSARTLSVHR